MVGPSGAIEPLDPATKVLEFESLGIKVRNTKRFFVLNPTSIAYEFEWRPASGAQEGKPFECATRRGVIGGGRHFEMVFHFTPSVDEAAEAFWTFVIPEQGISVPFLLAGLVAEPRVAFDRPSINFGQVRRRGEEGEEGKGGEGGAGASQTLKGVGRGRRFSCASALLPAQPVRLQATQPYGVAHLLLCAQT